jgi:Ion channel
MTLTVAAASVLLIVLVLADSFETMILPRRVRRQFRFARFFYVYFWAPWAFIARRIHSEKRRNTFLSLFGPLSIIILLTFWAIGLIMGFALLHWAIGTPLGGKLEPAMGVYAYFSGVTFFTLGYGDVTPVEPAGRFLAVVETGLGFGFLALVISYLPVLYQAFSRREVAISLLDARAGSPPTAGTFLGRMARFSDPEKLDSFFSEWERWAAEVLEGHLSFPVLTFYRSQHDNQSWLAALTVILDSSALVVAAAPYSDRSQAWLAFAMSRHVVVDLAQTFYAPPVDPPADRLPPERWKTLRESLEQAGLELKDGEAVEKRLTELRGMYEPFVVALSQRFLIPLPPVFIDGEPVDNWQTSAWMRRARGFRQLTETIDDHDD